MAVYQAKTKDQKCPFCEIVAGRMKTPGIFWEDNEFMAFLAIDPNTEGFSCVIPKEHYGSDILKMPNDILQRFILAAKTVAKILENYFQDVGRVGLIMEGTGIDHAHIKLVPMHETEYLKLNQWRQCSCGQEFWFDRYEGWICSGGGPRADDNKLQELANNIKAAQS